MAVQQDGRDASFDPAVSIIIFAGSKLIRQSLRAALEKLPGLVVAGDAADAAAAMRLAEQKEPAIMLLGGEILENGGIPFIQSLRTVSPDTSTLIINHGAGQDLLMLALEAGARGYVNKDADIDFLFNAILGVYRGELWVERRLMAHYFSSLQDTKLIKKEKGRLLVKELSRREREVLDLLSQGHTNKEISAKLYICEKTVKSHLNRIFKKLEVKNRLEATLTFYEFKPP